MLYTNTPKIFLDFVTIFNQFDFTGINSTADVAFVLKKHGCSIALAKKLAKNNNDKNQIYFHHDVSVLNSVFDLTFDDRDASKSETKRRSSPGRTIPQAIFNNFYWVNLDEKLERVKQCKAITYHQYPETRLSGFQTEKGEMPRSLSIEYTKSDDLLPRYLFIGATSTGVAVAVMLVNPGTSFTDEFERLDFYQRSKICKYLIIDDGLESNTARLANLLSSRISDRSLKGCRLDQNGGTVPFNGTQVHGYTLEHACDIKPNSNHDGDIYGIELKCFSTKKLSLITTEADGGLYRENYAKFMTSYGYLSGQGYRLTGIHRANVKNSKTGLTLKIVCFPISRNSSEIVLRLYDPDIPFAKQMNAMSLVLEDEEGNTAASWSIEHLMNRWGAKHNEVVYIPATVTENEVPDEISAGFLKRVKFGSEVLWCFRSTVEDLIKAIHAGTIFLDPAPKYSEVDSKRNKRRTQWRLNNIYRAAPTLYERSEIVYL